MEIQRNKPLVGWFTKDEYEKYLEEVRPCPRGCPESIETLTSGSSIVWP